MSMYKNKVLPKSHAHCMHVLANFVEEGTMYVVNETLDYGYIAPVLPKSAYSVKAVNYIQANRVTEYAMNGFMGIAYKLSEVLGED